MIQKSEPALKIKTSNFPTLCGYWTETNQPKTGKSESKEKTYKLQMTSNRISRSLSAWQAFQSRRLWGTKVLLSNIRLSNMGALGHLLVEKGSAGKTQQRPLPRGSQGFVLRFLVCLQRHFMKYREATQLLWVLKFSRNTQSLTLLKNTSSPFQTAQRNWPLCLQADQCSNN